MSLLYAPRDVDFEERLSQKYSKTYIQKHKWKYYHLFSLLLKKRIFKKKNKVWHDISSTALRKMYGRSGERGNEKWVHRLIRDDFKQWGVVIHHTEQVEEKKRISRYKILDERMISGFRLVGTVVPRKYAPQKSLPVQYEGIHGKIQKTASRLRINHDAAQTFIDEAYTQCKPLKDKPIEWEVIKKTRDWSAFRNRIVDVSIYSRWLWHLHKLSTNTYGFKVDVGNTNRLFYVLTQIPSHLRDFMLLDGKPLVEVDITAAQPLLFTNMVLGYCQQQGLDPIPKDVLEWKALCEEPDPDKSLYPVLHDIMNKASLWLDSHVTFDPVTKSMNPVRSYTKLFKAEFFAKIFFDKDNDTQMRRVFTEKFPTVSAAITHYKSGGHSKLSVALQSMEAELVIGTVCTRLYEKKITALPVHDALYVPVEHKEATEAEIKRAFIEMGLHVQVK